MCSDLSRVLMVFWDRQKIKFIYLIIYLPATSNFVADRGILMTFGSGTHGSLGHGNYNDVLQAKIVEALIGFEVEQVPSVTSHLIYSIWPTIYWQIYIREGGRGPQVIYRPNWGPQGQENLFSRMPSRQRKQCPIARG